MCSLFHATLNTLEHSAVQCSKDLSASALSHAEHMRAPPQATASWIPLTDWLSRCCEPCKHDRSAQLPRAAPGCKQTVVTAAQKLGVESCMKPAVLSPWVFIGLMRQKHSNHMDSRCEGVLCKFCHTPMSFEPWLPLFLNVCPRPQRVEDNLWLYNQLVFQITYS